ncbi:MAG TPA: DUF1549 and DUF1553 domain-containing protein, partial [Gemmataceae bacterium]|nr:DUF1549 and DUF1553 domain-containing protein [Gemmataceae bacterium]
MRSALTPRLLVAATVFSLAASSTVVAGDLYTSSEATPTNPAVLPKPGEIKELTANPASINLIGADDAAQLIVTANLNSGRLQDLSGDAQYVVADPKVARITPTGRVFPLANGTTEITAKFLDKTVKVAVTAKSVDVDLPINFPNQVVPVFTKLGCNSGGCHGKASGQNGFKLSLLGFEPEVDYTALVKEARGRRVFPAAPERSLVLMKATGVMAHGGGKKMDPNSDEYKLVRRWIAAGLPYGQPTDPTVTKISIHPEHRILTRQNRQQFAVYAHYSDGHIEDITRRAQYDSNDQEIATVDPQGLVRTLGMSGEAAIMARYMGNVTTFRATVPLGPTPQFDFAENTIVDKFTSKKWRELGLKPSDLCSDEQFIRRVSLDITGTLPTPEQVTAFANDKDPKKRDKLVDKLLESPAYHYYFANKWADILRVKRRGQPDRAEGTFAFHNWILEAVAQDMPYSEFARAILAASGDEERNPPTVWYKELAAPENFVDDTAQVFLGLRMACANCHHHPYEKWSQDDYWGLAAFFARVDRKNIPVMGGGIQQQGVQKTEIYTKAGRSVINKRTQKPAAIKPLDGEVLDIASDVDPRQQLVDWMVDPKNPFFARAVANRYWAHFLGRGIVDPLDDMRVTNPPSNPELLDALAQNLIDNKYSLKSLIKTICKSHTYQLSSLPNDFNKHDKQTYARYYPKRLQAEVLLDAVCQVTGSPTQFGGLPTDQHAPNRAIMLPDESFTSYFLDVFG